LALLARSVVRLPRIAARLVAAGCAVDFAVGVLPQVWGKSMERRIGSLPSSNSAGRRMQCPGTAGMHGTVAR